MQGNSFKVNKIECFKYSPTITKIVCALSPRNRTTTIITAFFETDEIITEMMGNLVIVFKNSKNIYVPFANETIDYCKAMQISQMNYFGVVQKVVYAMDPFMLKKCPFSTFFGTRNMTIDLAALDNYPLWAFPTRNFRLQMKCRKNFCRN